MSKKTVTKRSQQRAKKDKPASAENPMRAALDATMDDIARMFQQDAVAELDAAIAEADRVFGPEDQATLREAAAMNGGEDVPIEPEPVTVRSARGDELAPAAAYEDSLEARVLELEYIVLGLQIERILETGTPQRLCSRNPQVIRVVGREVLERAHMPESRNETARRCIGEALERLGEPTADYLQQPAGAAPVTS